MTSDEVVEAAALVKALVHIEETLEDLGSESFEAGDLVGIGLSKDHSDSGAMGLGPDALVPPAFARSALVWLADKLVERLQRLGVEPP